LATPELRRTVVTHVHDLVAVALGATRDATDIARIRGLRAARLRAAKVYIIENSHRRDLSIGTVAAHLGLTPRYLQRLFEEDGRTYSAFLLHQRLARAYRLLTQPRFPQNAVSTVAYDVGFGDLSYFIRCFKRHYGATPGDLRQEAGRGLRLPVSAEQVVHTDTKRIETLVTRPYDRLRSAGAYSCKRIA